MLLHPYSTLNTVVIKKKSFLDNKKNGGTKLRKIETEISVSLKETETTRREERERERRGERECVCVGEKVRRGIMVICLFVLKCISSFSLGLIADCHIFWGFLIAGFA